MVAQENNEWKATKMLLQQHSLRIAVMGTIAVPSEKHFPRRALADKTRSKFTQKPRVIVSECTHAHEVSTCFARCEVVSSKKGEPSQEMDLCSTIRASPNAKAHGALTMLCELQSWAR